jgi:hypothetical protein
MEPVRKKAIDSFFSNSLYFSTGVLAREVEKLAVECWKPTGLSPSHAVYDRARMVMIAPDGANLIALIEKCDDDFRNRCEDLLGKNTSMLSRTLNESADKLREAKNDCPAADTKSSP